MLILNAVGVLLVLHRLGRGQGCCYASCSAQHSPTTRNYLTPSVSSAEAEKPRFGTCVCSVASVVSHSAMLWTVACQTPLPMGLSRQEYWNALPYPSSGDLPDPGIEPTSLTSPALPGGFFGITWEAPFLYIDIGY